MLGFEFRPTPHDIAGTAYRRSRVRLERCWTTRTEYVHMVGSNGFVYVMYSRVFFQIALCNDFLRNTTPTALAANDVPEDVAAQIQTYRAEARVLRALSYWHAIDLFGAVSFVTEVVKE